MIFNEIYSAYYNAVAKIIRAVMEGKGSEQEFQRIVSETAFGESFLTILPSLKSQKWQLIKPDMTTPLKHIPTMPLTTIQKQWLKAISLDPRLKLFGIEIKNLDNVEPLFTPADYVIYDKYADGDPYDDEEYVKRFQMILSAIKTGTPLKLKNLNRKGQPVSMTVRPVRLEYSEKDDKFRLICKGCRYGGTVNLARIISCELCQYSGPDVVREVTPKKQIVTVKIKDVRNALERAMLHFAHFEKQAERIDDNNYLLKIRYDRDDETEMVIRILSFGARAEVVAPEHFRKLIIDRLISQKSCGLS